MQRRIINQNVITISGSMLIAGYQAVRHKSFAHAEGIPKLQLYQYKICPFCNKVKAYLDFLRIDYEAIEVDPLLKTEIKFSKDYKKVPIMLYDGNNQLNDSKSIISFAKVNLSDKSKREYNKKVFYPEDTDKWDEWSEKKLAVMLYPNITRSLSESWECFSYATEVPTWNPVQRQLVRSAGAVAMYFANGKIKKKYNIVNEREELNRTVQEWCAAVGDKKFLHGDEVSMPDLLVYGVLHSIEGLQTHTELMNSIPKLKVWYSNVAKAI